MAKRYDKTSNETARVHDTVMLALAWLAVGVPLAWGVVETLKKAMALFGAA
jgi:hypothetical protein